MEERREGKEMFMLNSLGHWRAPLKKLGVLGSFSTSKLIKIYELLRRFSEFDQILYQVCSQSKWKLATHSSSG